MKNLQSVRFPRSAIRGGQECSRAVASTRLVEGFAPPRRLYKGNQGGSPLTGQAASRVDSDICVEQDLQEKANSRPTEKVAGSAGTSWLVNCLGVAFELAKVRVSLMVVATAEVGYLMASGSTIHWGLMVQALAATGLLAGGAAALNQWIERDFDRLMNRTKGRPMPSGRVRPWVAWAFGVLLGVSGFVWLLLCVNTLTAVLGAATFLLYVGVYTPLKRVTIWNTVIGAIPGAIPPMMGWAAVRGELAIEAWLLFAVLFCWQMPHFYAIAWLNREDYRRAGYRMLSHHDESGAAVGRHSVVFAGLLLIFSVWLIVFPGEEVLLPLAPPSLLCSALTVLLGGYFLFQSLRFAFCRSRQNAKRLFFASILYVPLVSLTLVGQAVWSERIITAATIAVGGTP